MKKTIIKIEHETGSPLDIEINGKQLTSVIERAFFYVTVVLLALGAVWAIFYVFFPLVWFVLKLSLSVLGFGFIVIVLILVVAFVIGLLKWHFGGRRKNDYWDD